MQSARMMSWLSAAMLLVTLALAGAIVGGLVVTRIVGTSGMGWDQLADLLSGFVAGGGLGVAAGIVAIRIAGPRARLRLTAAAVAGGVAAMIYVQFTPPRVRSRPAAALPAPAVAPFTWQIGVADGLAGPPEDEPLPWTFLRIVSNGSLDYVPAGGPDTHCRADAVMHTPEGIAALTELRAILAGMPAQVDCGEPCPRCMEVSLQWFLDAPRAVMITDRCWRAHEALQPLRASVERLFAMYGGAAECTPAAPSSSSAEPSSPVRPSPSQLNGL
jgi:hypothetical protein